MSADRFPIDLIHGRQILLAGDVDVHPGDVAKVHLCRTEDPLEFVQGLAHFPLKIVGNGAICVSPVLASDVKRSLGE